MKILIDMNLSPQWSAVFQREGWEAVHWSTVGQPDAADRDIMTWAAKRGFIVFTHDLDFGAMLAATHATAPSVIQARTQDVLPDRLGPLMVKVLHQHRQILLDGALVIVDEQRARLRILPLR